MSTPRVVLQAPVGDRLGWLSLEKPRAVVVADRVDQIEPVLRQIEAAADHRIAAGFVSYEAAPAFDPALKVRASGAGPLAWFAIFDQATTLEALPTGSDFLESPSWRPSITADEHDEGIAAIHRHIAAGDTYQVNFTHRLDTSFAGNPWQLFLGMCLGQDSRCCAFIDTGDRVICSASPELFFRLEGDEIWSRPMKGTAPRGRTLEEDSRQAEWLRTSPKNRAENLMIVDMVRNDLGRIALPQSVAVSDLWQLEKYPSVWQMTSTVRARTHRSLPDIFAALFPCASVTGAPKIRAMEIIHQLESTGRGVYTGAIGIVGPGRRARFNVAIRTVEIDARARRATYGTGSGVVWDSIAREEWNECRTKALVLQPPAPPFELLETVLWRPETGLTLLDRHLRRLANSADYFGYSCASVEIERALAAVTDNLPLRPHRIRLLLDRHGQIRVESAPLARHHRPWRLAVAAEPIASDDPFLFHKTTHREIYRRQSSRFPDHDDVLLWNERGEITESTLANVVLRRADHWLTPPIRCGLLAGTLRAELLEQRRIEERVLRLEDLTRADEVWLINSVRGWIDCRLDTSSMPPRGD